MNPEQLADKFGAYILKQLDKTTAWIGLIGLALWVIQWNSMLFILFVTLIVLPEASFSSAFKKFTQGLRDIDKPSA